MVRLLLRLLLIAVTPVAVFGSSCNAVFVRWPRVRLNFRPVASGQLSLRACQSTCQLGEDPIHAGKQLECAALNHEEAVDRRSHHCEVFQPHQLQNVDGFVEADDRYSFFWKYCLTAKRKCTGEYAFTYYSDRYMEPTGVTVVNMVSSLEECLSACLDSPMACRSVSFNRTDGGCHLSEHSYLTRPHSIKVNNNPNYRIDFYENHCYNMSETFTFSSICEDGGIRVKVKSKFPYTGALYGLYDFFTCRVEPKEQSEFEYFFPSPMTSKNCSDSIRYKGEEMVLEVVLSTDGVEPLYFITNDDITFQAKCPIKHHGSVPSTPRLHTPHDGSASPLNASAHALFELLSDSKPKDTFPLPLTTTTQKPTTTTTQRTTTPTTTTSTTTQTTTTKKTTTTTTPATTTTTRKTTTTAATTTTKPAQPPGTSTPVPPPPVPEPGPPGSGGLGSIGTSLPISFEIFHNGLAVGAVVVGSRITLTFTPHFAIPPEYMSLQGCQVEPIGSIFDWELPLTVLKDGCPSDEVGIACPPQHTNYGIKVNMEAFRYSTTADIQYTCMVRVCPYAPCPVSKCSPVDGCDEGGLRGKRALSIEEIRAALQADPSLSRQIGLGSPSPDAHSHLVALSGDHVVKRRLVVVNSPDELRFFVSTGNVPN